MDTARFQSIDAIKWHVLNSLADDWESPEQIMKYFREFTAHPPTIDQLGAVIRKLFEDHYIFLTLNTLYDHDEVMKELREETTSRRFWFGRTDIGYMAWESLTSKYSSLKNES